MIDEEELLDEYMWLDRQKNDDFNRENANIPGYYKNILAEENQLEFEQILNYIQKLLKQFDTNLIYSEKIVKFINEEFNVHGAFPMDLMFLNQFLINAIDTMILTASKLVFDHAKIRDKKNGGLNYLKSYIGQHRKVEQYDTINPILKEVKPLFRQCNELGTQANIEVFRNSKIAHYDIDKEDEVKRLKIDLEILKAIYISCSQIFEKLSLKYFERISIFDDKMINKHHDFQKHVCENLLMHNPNPFAQTDLDCFLDVLRNNFIDNLKTKQTSQL